MAEIHDARPCELGEGPLWHPLRDQLFWFDILGRRLLSRDGDEPLEWRFDDHVSAAGWIDRDTLLIASETGLWRFSLADGQRDLLHPLEADSPATRSNDGRADPMGGFWIGTMGKRAEEGAGAIYRLHAGTLRRLVEGVTIPNAICFAPDGRHAYYADSAEAVIRRQPLDGEGWPDGPATPFLDLGAQGLVPDGAVTDSEGALWVAQWGAGRVARYHADGRFDRAVPIGPAQTTCPVFGGAGLATLFVTTARENLDDPAPEDGTLWRADPGTTGRSEPQVLL